MTAPGVQLFTYLQTGKETTHGTLVAATRQWYGQGSGELNIDDMLSEHRGNRGTREDLASVTSKGIAVDIAYQSNTDIGLAWNELPILYSQLDGTIGFSGGGADKTSTCAPSMTGSNAQKSFTLELGDDVQEFEGGYGQIGDFTISAAKDGMTQCAANWWVYDIAKSTKTAVAANKDVRIPGYLWKPRWASAQSGLSGASDVLNFMTDFSINHQTGQVRRYYQDGLPGFGQTVESKPQSATMTLHVEGTSTAVSEFYDKKRAGTADFMQLHALGPALGGSNYEATLQYAWIYTDVKPIASVDEGVNIWEVTAKTTIDPTWATNFSGVFVTALTAL